MKLARACLLACVAPAVVGCVFGSPEPLLRVSHGVPYPGRFIEPEAYAAYARGAELEALGELEAALKAYERAQALDPESAEIWARIASVQCRNAPATTGIYQRGRARSRISQTAITGTEVPMWSGEERRMFTPDASCGASIAIIITSTTSSVIANGCARYLTWWRVWHDIMAPPRY